MINLGSFVETVESIFGEDPEEPYVAIEINSCSLRILHIRRAAC